ncbi:VC1465 family Xer recombination activation factor [Pseudoxanthomonas winnipegensis]|uniref:VC1465 family Xer recombination activation factor n=1 Tax=Pseudoxanthomonas winnipegensis TaxID=2480810 RepID=UPI001D184FA8|nr:VC1465 family Xer recombination activation factor [Pseudoxanthomonas winnipegensis]
MRDQADRFRVERLTLRLTIPACAELLRVSPRTVSNWEAGKVRIPYASYKLMRVLRGSKLLGPEWSGFSIRGSRLCTPEGRELHASDLAWWSLMVLQAQEYRHQRAVATGRHVQPLAAAMLSHCRAPAALVQSRETQVCRQSVDTSGDFSPLWPVNKIATALRSDAVRTPRAVGPSSNTGQKVRRRTWRTA